MYDEFNGKMKWLSADTSNVTGSFDLAQLEIGLTPDDFGAIGFMNSDWQMDGTSITIASPSPVTVSEPSGLLYLLCGVLFVTVRSAKAAGAA